MVQRIRMREITQTEQPYGPEQGQRDFGKVSACLKDRVAALDLEGIERGDLSWSREAIGRLVERHSRGHGFYLERLTPPVLKDNISGALTLLGVSILSRGSDGKWEVLGRRPTREALEVLQIVEKQKETTARAICAALKGLSMAACNNRLKDLLAAGLIVREEGEPRGRGRPEFIYRALR